MASSTDNEVMDILRRDMGVVEGLRYARAVAYGGGLLAGQYLRVARMLEGLAVPVVCETCGGSVLLTACEAAIARIKGEWDNPALVAQGPITTQGALVDVETYLRAAIAKAKGGA